MCLRAEKLSDNSQCGLCVKATAAGISIAVAFGRMRAPKCKGMGQFKASICDAIINSGMGARAAFYSNDNSIGKGGSYVRFK